MWKLRFIGTRMLPTWEVTGSPIDINALYQQLRAFWHVSYFQMEDARGEIQDTL